MYPIQDDAESLVAAEEESEDEEISQLHLETKQESVRLRTSPDYAAALESLKHSNPFARLDHPCTYRHAQASGTLGKVDSSTSETSKDSDEPCETRTSGSLNFRFDFFLFLTYC